MATSADLNESYSNFSDEYQDFPCYSCTKEGRNVGADKFCVDCNHLLCSTCLGHHNKFDIMKCHKLLDKTASCGRKDKPDVPTMKCGKHDGKLLDLFCKIHDEPCCAVCVSLDHSACTEKDYLPNVAKEKFKKEELEDLNISADSVKQLLEKSKKKRLDNMKKIADEKATILQSIKDKRDAINKHFDGIENELKHKLDRKFSGFSNELSEEVEQLEECLNGIGDDQSNCATSTVTQNKSDLFIVSKQLEHRIRNGLQLDKDCKWICRGLKLIELCSLSKVLEAIYPFVFGYITGDGEIEAAVKDSEYSIRDKDDATVSCITDCCLMQDGNFVLADSSNRNLKKLDSTFQLKESLSLPGKPCAVCPTGRSEVAVSILSKKAIQFVSTEKPMSTTNSFKVGESCRGLVYYNNMLYLSCGGMTKYNDGPGEIRICDRSGNLIRKISEEAAVPKRMSVSSEKVPVDVFVADELKGVLCLNTIEHCVDAKNIFRHKDMVSAVGICYAGRGQIVVCGNDSNNVMLISSYGTLIKELLTKNNGITKPRTVCLDQTGFRLLVAMTDTDLIKVFHLERK